MNKRLIIFFSISVFAGLGYMAWSMTPIGKTTIAMWLVNQWDKMSANSKQSIDSKYLLNELRKLSYEDHELLARLTWLNPAKEESDPVKKSKKLDRLKKLMDAVHQSGMLNRANLSPLENIILPG